MKPSLLERAIAYRWALPRILILAAVAIGLYPLGWYVTGASGSAWYLLFFLASALGVAWCVIQLSARHLIGRGVSFRRRFATVALIAGIGFSFWWVFGLGRPALDAGLQVKVSAVGGRHQLQRWALARIADARKWQNVDPSVRSIPVARDDPGIRAMRPYAADLVRDGNGNWHVVIRWGGPMSLRWGFLVGESGYRPSQHAAARRWARGLYTYLGM